MPDLHVTPHGARWSLREGPQSAPISEYATRAEAEMAARAVLRERGGEGEVVVSEEDPTGLAPVEDREASDPIAPSSAEGGDPVTDPGDAGAAPAGTPERLRENQGGL